MQRRSTILSLLVLAAFLVVTCWILVTLTGGVSQAEVSRIPAPDGILDAVVLETNGGATTSFGYLVYITPRGASVKRGQMVARLYGASLNGSAYGVNLRWLSSEALAVEYFTAESASLEKTTADLRGKTVRVSLRELVLDTNAPAGGMLFNLQQRRPK